MVGKTLSGRVTARLATIRSMNGATSPGPPSLRSSPGATSGRERRAERSDNAAASGAGRGGYHGTAGRVEGNRTASRERERPEKRHSGRSRSRLAGASVRIPRGSLFRAGLAALLLLGRG